MASLEALTRDARALANGEVVLTAPEAEVARQMTICNACRYCEGFCAVFPAMTRRLEFGQADVHFLANLCHNCGACLHACQYAPPHEFAVNVPRAMACGTFSANSCGGAYWQACRQAQQLWHRLAR